MAIVAVNSLERFITCVATLAAGAARATDLFYQLPIGLQSEHESIVPHGAAWGLVQTVGGDRLRRCGNGDLVTAAMEAP